MEKDKIQVFDNQPIRTAWDEKNEEWYFSVVDVVCVLTNQPDRRHGGKYWSVLKTRMKKEGSQLTTNCSQLKLKSDDVKRYKTDVANTEQLLRIIQSIPSKKAEPFKLWQAHGVEKGTEYAILTDEVTKAWSGMSTRQYKNLKGLKKENLRDNMSTLELALNMLAEATTTELTKTQNPQGLEENRVVAKTGGQAQRWARRYDTKIVSDYMDGSITREQFWVLAKFKYPTHQINFCTKEALKCLEYRGFEEVLL